VSQTPEAPLPQDEDAGLAFRTQMALYDFGMKYWKEGVAIVGVFLVGTLVYSKYLDLQVSAQRGWTGDIAAVEETLPDMVRFGLSGANLSDDDRTAARDVADKLSEIGKGAEGSAAAEAWLKAAEYYRIAGEGAQRRAALEAAVPHAEGLLRYSAEGAIASLDLEEGKGEDAVARLRSLSAEMDGYLAEQAAFDLGSTLEHLGDSAGAIEAYNSFITTYPESSFVEEATTRKTRLASEG
jgi:tetratricopeptide (TPR) repeat protein